ncbi:hypothetical protein APF79_04185 [bacterium BRH_c32]|nr:MAG: hypothetical protein APF79_04185 [bacterium BRH_c32]
MKEYYKYLLPLIIIFLAASVSYSQEIERTIDSIPRDRLVTDSELLKLIDSSQINIKKNNEDVINQLVEYFINRNNVKYFFDKNSFKEELEEFRTEYPEEVESICKRSTEYIDTYGKNLDWKIPGNDLFGRESTPNTIRYIARFPRASENVLCAIYTKKKEAIEILTAQLKDFIDDYETGNTEIGGNDVFERFYAGHRTRNLLFAYQMMLYSNNLSQANVIYFLKVFLLHGARLIDDCKEFHYGNHQLHGLAGLYEMTTMFPEFPVMKLWNEMALKTILLHAEREINDDGFQFERASHYFKLDIMNYFRIYKIAKINDKNIPELLERKFHKMFDAIVNLALPTKALPVLQDAQAIYSPQNDSLENNNAAELSDPKESFFLSIGASVFNDKVYKYFASEKLYPELFWFFNKNERIKFYSLKAESPSVGSIALEQSKYFVMRSGWDINDLYMVIDGGLAKYKPDHTHGGVLGVMAYGYGIPFLPTYRVHYSDLSYQYLKNSLVKNVALADKILQGQNWIDNNARTGFGIWEHLPKPSVNEWITGNHFDYFSASHNGFDNAGVTYNRSIIFIKPYFWIFIDQFNSNTIHSYQQLWQGEYSTLKDKNGIIKTTDKAKLYIIQADNTNLSIEPYSKYDINSILFEKESVDNYSFNTLVYPATIDDNDIPAVREYNHRDYKLIAINKGTDRISIYFKKNEKLSLPELKTNASMIILSYKNEILKSALVYQGSNIEVNEFNINFEKPMIIEIEKDLNGNWINKELKGYTENNSELR